MSAPASANAALRFTFYDSRFTHSANRKPLPFDNRRALRPTPLSTQHSKLLNHDLRGRIAAVVVGAHDATIGAGVSDGDDVAFEAFG